MDTKADTEVQGWCHGAENYFSFMTWALYGIYIGIIMKFWLMVFELQNQSMSQAQKTWVWVQDRRLHVTIFSPE